jgi:hypothetical protein
MNSREAQGARDGTGDYIFKLQLTLWLAIILCAGMQPASRRVEVKRGI